ncbi:ligand-effect modulator 3 family [Chytriomyces cf. hyalinus JEL632]|nr:ligand-effect modulator 3 family [Chytriomyces cf. hyalinus JEL632]
MADHKSKRPANTAFKQQRLKAWQPILTPKTVLPAFFMLGVVFVPIGIALYLASNNVQQIIFDYTTCSNAVFPATNMSTLPGPQKICEVTFTIEKDMPGPVFMYYRLTNFYQNHRRYVKSFDANQLANINVNPTGTTPPAPTSVCSPLSRPSDAPANTYSWVPSENGAQKFNPDAVIYPCGLIANSYFSDVLSDITTKDKKTTYSFQNDSIAWPSDAAKFKPSSLNSINNGNITNLVFPPPEWVKKFPQFKNGYTNANLFDASQQRFQVWMRPAGLPNFRKLWGESKATIPAGEYTMRIEDSFDVSTFGGTKSVVISTVSILGGKNPFLGIAYIVVGIICWILGLLFLIRHMIKPRKLGDYTYLSWNQPQRGAGAEGQSTNAAGAGPSQRY